MNLVELATELEYVPKDQLAQLSQDPSSRYPQYLVLSEIQRRTANEKAYAAARPQPTTTVAEEVVGEFVQPMSLQAGMPSESAPTDVFSSESMSVPASAPMQQPMMMANGGLTSYAQGGRARASINRSFETPFLDDVREFAGDRYYDEEGDFNYGTALLDASLLIPGFGIAGALGRGAVGLGRTLTGAVTGKGVKDKAIRGLQSLFTKPGVSRKEIAATRKQAYEEARKRAVDQQKKSLGVKTTDNKQLVNIGKDTLVPMGSKNLPIKAGGRVFDPKKTLKTIGYPTAGAYVLSGLGGEDAPETKEDLQDLGTLLAAERPKKGIDYDLVGLGGLIMGARDMSEFGKGLSDFAQTSANRKIEREFKEAQMAKLRADTKALSFNEIQGEIQLINEGFETGALNMEDPVIQNYLMSLYQALAKRRGGTLQDDILKQQEAS
jgi:hypothetical protein|tara:strand:- start:154 stop:1464 length:1311 start_codon:yes stop_codon:yes gene_type:complete